MPENITITFLGTGSTMPSLERNHPAVLLSYKGETMLFDCGEGTQRQFRKAKINPGKITRLLISHWHGDHVLGIPGLLQTLAFSDYKKTLHIYGPVGTKKFMNELFKTFVFSGKIKLEIHEITKKGIFFDGDDFYLSAEKMEHGAPCNAYSFVIKDKIRIDKTKLAKLKIPRGAHLADLKKKKKIKIGKKIYLAKDLTFVEKGKKVSFVFDTCKNARIVPFVWNSDVLIMESTYDAESEDFAKAYKHMTCVQDAAIAKKAKVKQLALIHISQRYQKHPHTLLAEAKKTFKHTIIPNDLDVVEV